MYPCRKQIVREHLHLIITQRFKKLAYMNINAKGPMVYMDTEVNYVYQHFISCRYLIFITKSYTLAGHSKTTVCMTMSIVRLLHHVPVSFYGFSNY